MSKRRGKFFRRIPRGRRSISSNSRFGIRDPHQITTVGLRGGVRK